jgi:hypothetical protein
MQTLLGHHAARDATAEAIAGPLLPDVPLSILEICRRQEGLDWQTRGKSGDLREPEGSIALRSQRRAFAGAGPERVRIPLYEFSLDEPSGERRQAHE